VGIKILLADDSVTAQNMGKKILSEAGHDVVTVSNGAAAAKKIAEVKPELVLLDVFMPGYSGLELCERLRNAAETAKLPVLLTVGRMEPYSPQDGARVKADGVIVKPFEATDLTAAVERFAQKSKEEQQPGGYERTIKIPAPPGSRDDTGRESQKLAVAAAPEQPRAYEQTMRLDPAQIAALLSSTAAKPQSVPKQEFTVPTAAAPAVEEFGTPRPPHTEVPAGEAAAPALGSDLLPAAHSSEAKPAAIPSYMAQYLDPSADDADLAVTARPAVGPAAEFDVEQTVIKPSQEKISSAVPDFPAIEQSSPTIPISNDVLSHHFPGDINPPPVASAEGLELTAVAPVPDVPVVKESGLETTIQSVDAPTIVLKDPALVTDPHRAAMDFPTQFGVTEAQVTPELAPTAEAAPAPVDEFEARLKAAMASYEHPPTDLPLPAPVEMSAELRPELGSELPPPSESHIELVPELPPPTEPQAEVVSELPSPIEAVSAFDATDEPFFATAPIGSSDLALPEPTPPLEIASEVLPSNVVEFPSSVINAPTATASEYEKAIEEATAAVEAHSPQVSATADQHITPADTIEEANIVPMAMATAAAASVPVVAPSHSHYDAEAELAHALKAAMSEPASTESASLTAPEVEAAHSPDDANRIAAAVEKVMQRELPGLIWKIMAELDISKR